MLEIYNLSFRLQNKIIILDEATSSLDTETEEKIQKAIDFVIDNQNRGDKDLRVEILKGFSTEPYHSIKGPTKKRGESNGLIIKDGYIIASWGDTKRVDMTFSVTKSYLSTVAGIAHDRKLISLDDNLKDDKYLEILNQTLNSLSLIHI